VKQTKMPASATVISDPITNISLQQCDELSVDFAVISRPQQSTILMIAIYVKRCDD